MDNYSVKNPIQNKDLYTFKSSSDAQINQAFEKAHKAFEINQAQSINIRIKNVNKLRAYILKHREEIANKIILETGKSRFDALTSELFEVIDVIDVITKKAEKALKNVTVSTPLVLMGKKSRVQYHPLGTILIITPWNYPFYQMLIPSIFAYLSGNAVIVKPSETTPLKGVIEELMEKSGFQKDMIQVVYGDKTVGQKLIEKKPNKIHFTGSTAAGKAIMKQAAEHLIPVDLELGGKDPSIVFEDVNINRTVNGVMWGGFTTAGQSCTSIERLYIHESIYDHFINELANKTKKLRTPIANSDIEQPDGYDVGCITSEKQLNIIESHIADAVEKGAKILCGGSRKKDVPNCFLPTVLVDVDHSMKIMTEETFGPVIPVMKFSDEAQVIKWANTSEYGLGASVWSKDLKRANRVASALHCGNVSINNHMITEANPNLPFGGIKQSGIGRYKGVWGFHTFSYVKSVLVDKQSGLIEPHWYPFTKTKYRLLNTILDHLLSEKKNWLKVLPAALKLDSIGKKEQIK